MTKRILGNTPNAETSLLLWYQRNCDAEWQSLVDTRRVFPSADLVGNFMVFNIGGNN